ncbi:MAG: CvpA family protein, partial [Planctomycetota bacterium]
MFHPAKARKRRGGLQPDPGPLAVRAHRRHDAAVHVQQATQGGASEQLVHTLQTLDWVDHTTLGVLLVFFVLGLFKGLIWQVSRIGILVAAYVVSGRYGNALADWLARSNEADAPTDPSST